MGALAYDEAAFLPSGPHPLSLLFPDVVKQFREEKGVK